MKLWESKRYQAMAHEGKGGAKHDLISLCEKKSYNYFLFPHCLLRKRRISNPPRRLKLFTEYSLAIIE
jgi:hypothetical protein